MAKAKKEKEQYSSGHELMKAQRHTLGLSLRQLSNIVDVNASHIKDIEKGRKVPSISRTLKLLRALQIPIKDYFEAVGYEDVKRVKGKVVAVQGVEPRTLRI